jgi:PAS domain S-box-containing protein
MEKHTKNDSVLLEELYASELSYRSLFESSKDGILILDAKTGKIVDVNPFLIDLLGYTKKEFIEKSIWEIGSFRDIFENKEKFQELQHKKYVRYDNLPLITACGKIIHVEFISNIYLVNNKKIIQCNIRDISVNKEKENSIEEEHRATSEILNILLDHMYAPMIIWDTSMIITRLNLQFELLSGYDSAEIIDKKIDILFPKEKIAATIELLKYHLDEDHKVTEIDILTKDKKIKTVLWSSSRILDEEGKKIIATISQDITRRKFTEDALNLSETRYRRLFESAKDGILILDAETGKIVDVNPFLIDLLGYSKEEFIEKFIWEIGSFQDVYENKEKFEELQSKEYVRYDDLPLVTSDGREIHVEFVSNVYLENKIKVIQCNIRNITTRRLSDLALRKSESHLRALVNTIPDLIWLKNTNGVYLSCNPMFERFFGADENDIIGKTDYDYVDLELADFFRKNDKKAMEAGKPTTNEEWVTFADDGHRALLETIKSPIYDSDGTVLGVLGIGRDITERKHAEMELISAKERAEESDRLKTAFLHNISHEIRTPMNAIVGFSAFLNEPDLTSDKRKDFTDIIIQSSDQLLAIIDDIIRIASIESGQEKIQESEIDINLVCKLLNEQFTPKTTDRNVQLNLKTGLPDDNAIISTDAIKLTQILTNLIGNAFKFTLRGYINFGYSVKNNLLEFYVEDSGMGIPLDMQEKIFNRFRQVETTDNRNFGGAGLGLSISKAYVKMLGGSIWVNSELGKGSVFYFTIPFKNTNPKKNPDKLSNKDINLGLYSNKTLLIAEDNDSNFMLLNEMLAGSGINIIRAVNGVEAVKLCRSNPDIDLVLMDIKMPELDGYAATAQIKEFNPGLPIIAQTAYSTEVNKIKALECGCSDFICKPINKKMLFTKINEQLHK